MFDAQRGQTVLFGGTGPSGRLAETWLWDGANWTQASPALSPPARQQFAMAYDQLRGRVVLFGGAGLGNLDDTWEWDGTTWTQVVTASRPPVRCCQGMVYDVARARMVLFGGYDNGMLRDTWEYDGTSWTQRTPVTSPPARCCYAMSYDVLRGRTVLYGGAIGASTGDFGDTWEWDGNDWQQRALAVAPAARRVYAAVFSRSLGRTVLFGGSVGSAGAVMFTDTWEYQTPAMADYTSFGTGCAGSAGTPAFSASGSVGPWLGDVFRLALSGISANAAALALIGRSRTSWNGIPLPLSLVPNGMPGCSLYVSGQLILPVPVAGGTGTLALSVPNDPALLGAHLYVQAFATDATANPAGLVASNAGDATFGAR